MFIVNGKEYTVRFNSGKFKRLGPYMTGKIMVELFSTFDGKMSNQTMKSLFTVGLEEKKTGVQVPIAEAEKHYNQLIKTNDRQRIKGLRDFLSERIYKDMPEFFDLKNYEVLKNE